MSYNLLNHFAIALLMSLTVFVFVRRLQWNLPNATLFSLIPACVELLAPAPFYQHQMYFFADGAVILPFALYVFLEVLRDSVPGSRWRWILSFLQAFVAFWGILTEYLFALVALCVYLKRIAQGKMGATVLAFLGRSVAFWFSFGLALALFAGQLYLLCGFEDILEKLTRRSVILHEPYSSLSIEGVFWRGHMVRGYGKAGVALLWASLAGFGVAVIYAGVRGLRGKGSNPGLSDTLALIFVLMVPCFLHAFFLKHHAANPWHDFSSLKFAIPLATVPFVLIPVLAVCSAAFRRSHPDDATPRPQETRLASRWPLLPVVMMAAAALYLCGEWPRALPQFGSENANKEESAFARFIGANTGYEDLVFTPGDDLTIEPWDLAFAMKKLYKAPSLQRVYAQVHGVEGEYVVNLVMEKDAHAGGSNLMKLAHQAYEQRTASGFVLYKVRKQDFLALCRKARVRPPRRIGEPAKPRAWKGQEGIIRRLNELAEGLDEAKRPE